MTIAERGGDGRRGGCWGLMGGGGRRVLIFAIFLKKIFSQLSISNLFLK